MLQLKIFLYPLISKHRHAERQGIFILTNMNKKHNESCKQYNIDNYEKIKERKKEYYLINKEKIAEKSKQYRIKNSDKLLDQKKIYYQKNKEARNIYQKNKRLNDPLFKLRSGISSLILISIKKIGYSKTSKTYKILGCSYEKFKHHLENQFTEGMNWENAGQWHLDHIYPVSLAKNEEHLIKLNHYTNFQPLWAVDNIKKGNKIIVSL